MSKTTSGTALPTGANDEQQNLPPLQEQTESKLPRNELTLIKKLPHQINEIVEQNARIERQLKGINKDIKHTVPNRTATDTCNKDWECSRQCLCKYKVREKGKEERQEKQEVTR